MIQQRPVPHWLVDGGLSRVRPMEFVEDHAPLRKGEQRGRLSVVSPAVGEFPISAMSRVVDSAPHTIDTTQLFLSSNTESNDRVLSVHLKAYSMYLADFSDPRGGQRLAPPSLAASTNGKLPLARQSCSGRAESWENDVILAILLLCIFLDRPASERLGKSDACASSSVEPTAPLTESRCPPSRTHHLLRPLSAMPALPFAEMNTSGVGSCNGSTGSTNSLDDDQFGQVAYKLSLLSASGALANGADSRDENSMPLGFGPMSGGGQQHQYGAAAPGMGMQQHPGPYDDHGRNTNSHTRRSANMTECVNVPSSEHVAEIVGRQVSGGSGSPMTQKWLPARRTPHPSHFSIVTLILTCSKLFDCRIGHPKPALTVNRLGREFNRFHILTGRCDDEEKGTALQARETSRKNKLGNTVPWEVTDQFSPKRLPNGIATVAVGNLAPNYGACLLILFAYFAERRVLDVSLCIQTMAANGRVNCRVACCPLM
ncbi:hypothetical protein BaRGS_00040375 [Batillaria attramentaria]|uniref:Uncharacterized protein n=1 Tax=Batillaria attramentaria TaxID=370345 RepID=A0ABD0J0D7_9CAEN